MISRPIKAMLDNAWLMTTAVILSVVVVFFVLVPTVFGQLSTATSNGYGYGYGCTADAPTHLKVKRLHKKNRIVLKWDEVEFDNCYVSEAAAYNMQLRFYSGKLVQKDTVSTNHKKFLESFFHPNARYKFKVQGVAVDDRTTEWSDYEVFRTKPAKVGKIRVKARTPYTIAVSWPNVVRSKQLKSYHVVLVHDGKEISSKNVKKKLKLKRAGTSFGNLEPDTFYTVKVQAVFSKKLKGPYSSRIVRTLPL